MSRVVSAAVLVALLAGCGSSAGSTSTSSTPTSSASTSSASTSASTSSATTAQSTAGTPGFEGVPIQTGAPIASAGTTGTATVDGISCGPTEQLAYHIHAHLAIYLNGTLRPLPGGIGIPGSQVVNDPQVGPVAQGGQCIYWLHTHAPDGVIHIESPTRRIYNLGTFFDEWRQPLGPDRVGAATGPVTAFVNGRRWRGGVRAMPLTPHAVIQLSIGRPVVPFRSVNWAATQL